MSIDRYGHTTVQVFPRNTLTMRADALYGYAMPLLPVVATYQTRVEDTGDFDPIATADRILAQYVHEITTACGL